MTTVMEFTRPATEFPLGTVFETLPTVTVELERLVPHEKTIRPYFWVRGAETDDIEGAFSAHPGVDNIKLVDRVDDQYLLRADWEQEYVGVLSAFTETGLVILSAVGTSDGWTFEVRGESREDIRQFHAYCRDNGISINITTIHALLPINHVGYGLTAAQREALVLAYEMGYFDSPREASLVDVADELGITQQSLSSRLRRGHRRLIGATLINE